MIANNIFRAIGDFCTAILFPPYKAFRLTDGWWSSNIINIVFISIGMLLFLYWLVQLQKFQKAGEE
ncbi:MAG: uracil phosphoribosyltransferase [Flavobacteriaceae bacterium]|nr:uracil phosphoribosyltransferase [Flavobacteriaceae bacterium]